MADQFHRVKFLELCRVAPPHGTTHQTTLPLTFFDLLWITCPSVQHILFYNSPQFSHNLLPLIKHSLSLALQRFYPLAGHLKWSQKPNTKPTLNYIEGDSIPLTIVESGYSFNHLVSNNPRQSHLFHPLVPHLASSDTTAGVLAVQLTLFPNSGFCIGFTLHHGIADGNTALQFMRAWSSFCKLNDDNIPRRASMFYDRSVIKDTNNLENAYLNDLRKYNKTSLKISKAPEVNSVRASFILSPTHINHLNQWLLQEKKQQNFYISRYVLVCAYVIICMVKARCIHESKKSIEIAFPTGCRTRLKYPIPETYFGNCIGICCTPAMECDMLRGEDGFVVAAQGIGRAIEKLGDGVLKGGEEWVKNCIVCNDSKERVMVAGTLKLDFYEIDFGWGRPVKSEVISLEKKGAFSLAECRDGDGGVEVGLALNQHDMDCFSSLFLEGLHALE